MRVNGIEIRQAIIDAAIARMLAGPFAARDVLKAVDRALHETPGLSVYDRHRLCDRIADRVIQDQRNAGKIKRCSGASWCVVPETGASDA
jgi:hypothetical protein